ncbi:BREX-1 system adenine-specific DNA-methyltransferase PglX [Azoarcus communis]|uniref:BREX-1 system adenine-specific DNA-methyltransferase PglX n=1 Tax=Rhodocyclales TaxID=206389 RepID=UPI0014598A36|nr:MULTISPECIES: BREX-1 system adenine-specific DNA-methyltransferase PglX [Rhodocyclales]NMG49992.1 BREX-1 system adenine-specific DNA-methyltransferase PglX [Parazoarcus communis]NMG55073.1 BREX-1 system adenine-specific DNA-methyltransferase PglX [Aromatoleum aromaticum]
MSNSQASKADQGMERYFFRVSALEFKKISGSPIAYWASRSIFSAFESTKSVSSITTLHRGISTGNTDLFARVWHEVSRGHLCVNASSRDAARCSGARWFPYNRGGIFRKWYGLGVDIIDYQDGGRRMVEAAELGESPGFRHDGAAEYFLPTVTWTALTAGKPSFRLLDAGYVLGHKGSSIKTPEEVRLAMLCLLNSNVLERFLGYISPTLDINISQISSLPLPENFEAIQARGMAAKLVHISRTDWDSYETSWGFSDLALLHADYRQPTLKASYQKLRAHWREMTLEMQRLEQENNRIFIDAYGLQDELTPEVPLNEITLTCNPHYRYSNDKSEDELEALLLADTMRELVSYAVGCVFGRYSLDKPGLILANQGETLADYLREVPESSFPADDDNVIPMLDGDWFTDDIAERFRKFLRVAFGEEHYEENLRFVEQALNIKGKRNYSIRDYFLGEFYTDHVKRYKKRPIYWLFSSPKGSFNALIYMHRYRPDTVSVVLNDYLREFRTKLTSHKNHLEAVSISASASQGEKTKALKEIENITKMIAELEEYEREVLYPLATEQVEIDLDDGVKLNYPKLGAALKKIVGLDAKED